MNVPRQHVTFSERFPMFRVFMCFVHQILVFRTHRKRIKHQNNATATVGASVRSVSLPPTSLPVSAGAALPQPGIQLQTGCWCNHQPPTPNLFSIWTILRYIYIYISIDEQPFSTTETCFLFFGTKKSQPWALESKSFMMSRMKLTSKRANFEQTFNSGR